MTIWRMRTACWIPKATETHSEYVILEAFPGQQWLRERALVLRYTYTARLAHMYIFSFSILCEVHVQCRTSAATSPTLLLCG